MKKVVVLVLIITLSCSLFPILSFAAESERTLTDKELLTTFHNLDIKITRIDVGQKNLSQRIDGLGKRIDELANRIDGLTNMIMGGFIAVFVGIFSLIGFVLWDRRTALSPVISKTKDLEGNRDLTFKVLKEYALKEPKMAEVLKTLGLM